MEIRRYGHSYTLRQRDNGEYEVLKIISVHPDRESAFHAMYDALRKEMEEMGKAFGDEMRRQGISVTSFREAMQDMTPEERERSLEERNRKFLQPLLDLNLDTLKSQLQVMGRRGRKRKR